MPVCDVPHCDEYANSRQPHALCDGHYQVKYRGVDPYTKILSSRGPRSKCWVAECPKRANTKGLCNAHNKRAREGKLEVPEELGVELNPKCGYETCENLQHAGGYCSGHYAQWRKLGKLGPLRAWGEYTSGELRCDFPTCSKPSISKGFCALHNGKLSQYGITKQELLSLYEVGQ